jgi:hypothetical protein
LQDIFMTHRIDDVQIDRAHGGAICQEIGERLRISMGEEGDLSPPLRLMIKRLAKTEVATAA